MPEPAIIRSPSVRFEVLDGMRGLAALAVMLTHYGRFVGIPLFGGAVVSVDLFFILSGFVIAHSYQQKVLGGMAARRFASQRLIRLAPLYYVGLCIGIVASLLQPALMSNAGLLLREILFGAFGLPCLNDATRVLDQASVGGALFPLNDPAWSLFFELFVNAVFFAWLRYAKGRGLPGIVLLCVPAFLACTLYLQDPGPGWGSDGIGYGFPRVLSGFFLGVLIYRCRHQLAAPPRVLTLMVITAFFVLTTVSGLYWILFNGFVLAPLAVWLGASLQPGRLRGLCHFSGELSYPLYVLHYPLYQLLFASGLIAGLSSGWRLLVASVVAIALASLAAPWDAKLRARVRARIA